jgi:hypothetical protein
VRDRRAWYMLGTPGHLARAEQPKKVERGSLVIVGAGPAPGESYLRLAQNSLSLRMKDVAKWTRRKAL